VFEEQKRNLRKLTPSCYVKRRVALCISGVWVGAGFQQKLCGGLIAAPGGGVGVFFWCGLCCCGVSLLSVEEWWTGWYLGLFRQSKLLRDGLPLQLEVEVP
jgi:hypothetical protein